MKNKVDLLLLDVDFYVGDNNKLLNYPGMLLDSQVHTWKEVIGHFLYNDVLKVFFSFHECR